MTVAARLLAARGVLPSDDLGYIQAGQKRRHGPRYSIHELRRRDLARIVDNVAGAIRRIDPQPVNARQVDQLPFQRLCESWPSLEKIHPDAGAPGGKMGGKQRSHRRGKIVDKIRRAKGAGIVADQDAAGAVFNLHTADTRDSGKLFMQPRCQGGLPLQCIQPKT